MKIKKKRSYSDKKTYGNFKKIAFLILLVTLLCLIILTSYFVQNKKESIESKAAILPPPATGWTLSFSDDFNGTTVDSSKWKVANRPRDVGTNTNATFYTPDNVSVVNGILTLKVRNNQQYCSGSTCTNYSGGMLESYDANSTDTQKYRLFRYGYYEARIRYHMHGCGFWANFWMFARPQGPEEFDHEIMSCTGSAGTTSRANQIRPAYHYSGGTSFSWVNATYNDSWHTYGYMWLPGQTLRFFYDGQEIYNPPQIAHDKSMYINLRAGVGMKADTGGNPGPNTEFPGTAEYDYVRVYTYQGGNVTQIPLSPTLRPTEFPQTAGDVNRDGRVDILDFQLLSNSFGKISGQIGYNSNADFNNDNSINILDFQILSNNFGRQYF